MYPYDENENRNENIPGEENAAEENVNENAANPDAGAAEASAGCDNAAEEPDGSYRMEPGTEQRAIYRAVCLARTESGEEARRANLGGASS